MLGPNVVGAKDVLPGPLAPLGRRCSAAPRRLPVPVPLLVPEHPLQLIHEEDVGRALQLCIVGAGPPGAYNIAGEGVLTAADVAREFGVLPIRLPAGPAQAAARAMSRLPFLPPAAEWIEAASRPVDHGHHEGAGAAGLGPRYTGLEALRDTLRRPDRAGQRAARAGRRSSQREHLGGQLLGRLQLRHVPDARQLDVAATAGAGAAMSRAAATGISRSTSPWTMQHRRPRPLAIAAR